MIKKNYYLFLIIFVLFLFASFKDQNANEILLYADNISYDSNNNLVGKGNAKIITENKIITSDLIIYSKRDGKILLPIKFQLRDEKNNFYYGSNGFFSKDLEYAIINNPKILLNDGSRIVGEQAKRDKKIDIITKGVYSPCKSKIKIANFLCPIWQLEGEKMLHDYNKLFLYQKHSKMRVLNIPVFYTPYLVTPSPLRKKRKSGFLSPSLSLSFFDAKTSQSMSLPYYFNLSTDKELTFIPTINYGAGIDSSQRFNFDYNQILSGGTYKSELTFDSTFENTNSDEWLKEASFVNNYNQNINEKFTISISSALQTSKNYIQQTTPNDELSYVSSLNTSVTLNGYNLNKIDDKLKINISAYQSIQNNEDNKTIPTIMPYITYDSGTYIYKKYNYKNYLDFYNIFRDTATDIHSKSQKKISSTFSINKESIKFGTRINFQSNIYNQLYEVVDKKIDNEFLSTTYIRSFPIFGLSLESPFKVKSNINLLNHNFVYTPKISIVLTRGLSNTNKISNEDSSMNSYSIENNSSLNRFTGTDKLDNSKRIDLEFKSKNDIFEGTLWQSYEFTNNSNFHYSQGNEKKLSDFLGDFNLEKNSFKTNYNLRYDHHDHFIKTQNLGLELDTIIGNVGLSYLDQKSKTDETISTDNETINYSITSKKIKKFSQLSIVGLYDLQQEYNKESGISYSYFDECFGVNVDFKRNSYTEGDLKPQDFLTIMFSFKNVGSYKSTNLAVSANDKQDIQWDGYDVDNELFN